MDKILEFCCVEFQGFLYKKESDEKCFLCYNPFGETLR